MSAAGASEAELRGMLAEDQIKEIQQVAGAEGEESFAHQGKIPDVATLEDLDANGVAALEKLKALQVQHDDLEKQLQADKRKLLEKFRALKAPVFSSRAEILRNPSKLPGPDVGTVIPMFWWVAMRNHSQLREVLEPMDEPVLAFLQDITTAPADPADGSKGFSLTFKFAANPYFEPGDLSKTYHMESAEEDGLGQDATLVSTEATPIQWKAGKDITKKTVTRKQKNKRTKQIRKLTETVSVPSFFAFFQSHKIPSDEEMQAMTEDAVEELEVQVEHDYEIGCVLRDKIIPNALLWYTGEAVGSDESEDDDSDSNDEELEDETDVDEDDDDGVVPAAKKALKKGEDAAEGKRRRHPTEPPRCKQQ